MARIRPDACPPNRGAPGSPVPLEVCVGRDGVRRNGAGKEDNARVLRQKWLNRVANRETPQQANFFAGHRRAEGNRRNQLTRH